MSEVSTTLRERELMEHAVGAAYRRKHLAKRKPCGGMEDDNFRNGFCAGDPSPDYDTCIALVNKGLMVFGSICNKRPSRPGAASPTDNCDIYFHVSKEGFKEIGF